MTAVLASTPPPADLPGLVPVDRAVVVPTAANPLADRDEVVAPVRRLAAELAPEVDVLDLATVRPDDVDRIVDRADLVVVGGGDPFHLLATIHRSGFGDAVRRALRRGATYVGVSAGATAVGPTLAPLVDVSPFTPPVGLDLSGPALVDLLVLPHDDRPGRRARHESALRRWGAEVPMRPLADDERVIVDPDRSWAVVDADGVRLRPARPSDAEGVARTYTEAGRAEWSAFLGADRLAALDPPVDAWAERIGAGGSDRLVVAEVGGEVVGTVWVRHPAEPDLGPTVGEVAALSTRPDTWGRGVGRRLLGFGLDRLRAAGCDAAVLFTEERNARPRRVYEAGGWRLDGGARERTFLGAPLRELRYRRAL